MNYFLFNGHTSCDMGLTIEHAPEYSMPERIVDTIEVRGRNGDLIIDTGAYGNVEQVYHVYFDGRKTSFTKEARDIATWLLGSRGYMRLEDTYDPDVFRMAMIRKPETMNNFMNKLGRFDVTFECKPQRFLKIGEDEVTLITGDTIWNSWMPCHPIFKLNGSGTLTVNGNSIAISNNLNKTITIDCEIQNAYTGDENRNSDISVSGEFPYLVSGENTITFNNASCTMIPRYWSL